ncbi:MAG: hypothetical protein FJY67_02280 [Calditrichaeota bacterium]|nr:hypothetical protein [Calditrichota bacterium]
MKLLHAPLACSIISVAIAAAGPVIAADAHVPTDAACIECHSRSNRLVERLTPTKASRMLVDTTAMERSVHGSACLACHSNGTALAIADHPATTTTNCGRCHAAQEAEWSESIHGLQAQAGNLDAPRCNTCHGAHDIRMHDDLESPVYRRNLPATCATCHESTELQSKYRFSRNRLLTYKNSYHGIAVKFGRAEAADCASCHSAHSIRPSSDPRSSIHPANIPSTCGKCHPGAGEQFARGGVHVLAEKQSSPGMFYVRKFYTWFIGTLMVLFFLYIVIEHTGSARARRKERSREGGRR